MYVSNHFGGDVSPTVCYVFLAIPVPVSAVSRFYFIAKEISYVKFLNLLLLLLD